MGRKRSKKRFLKSTYEEQLADALDAEDVDYDYETERFPFVVKRYYKPDFVFYNKKLLVEAKGWFTGADRAKILHVRSAIEDEGWELRFVFQCASNTLSRRTETTYADWCDRHGFVWAEGLIPKEWYDA